MRKITAILIAILLLIPSQIASASFNDITVGEEYEDAVQYLTETGGISGNAENMFYPNELVTRAAFFKMLLANSGFDPEQEEKIYRFDSPKLGIVFATRFL